MELYFAYGSNLATSRMRGRVPSARAIARARLDDHRLGFDKRGRDGSGKANITPESPSTVWGVLYALEPSHWSLLDGFEPGYHRVSVEVTLDSGDPRHADTYRAIEPQPGLLPLAGYKRFICEGALEHGLPAAYRAMLEAAESLAG